MKKNYQFRYGSGTVSLPIEENQIISVIEGHETKPLDDIKSALYKSLDTPIESDSLEAIASKAGKIVIVVSDRSRNSRQGVLR